MSTIRGITATAADDGRVVLVDAGTDLLFTHEDSAATASYRFSLPGNRSFAVPSGSIVAFRYDANDERWRLLWSGGSEDAIARGIGAAPGDFGYYVDAWNYDPVLATSSAALATAGKLYNVKIMVPYRMDVSHILTYIVDGGTSLTTGQCFAAIYGGGNSYADLIAQSEDQSGNWFNEGDQECAMYLGATYNLYPGLHQVSFWFNGTTGPSFACAANNAGLVNFGQSSDARFSSSGSSITTTAPSTVGTKTAVGPSWWVGLTGSWPG